MDYEKKYNEALERANAAIDIAADKDLVGGVVRTIFPELRESEDERIRKKLYNTVMGTPNDSTWFDGTSKEAILAWLEKQKESNRALEEAARHVYESWMGGTMDDVRRDMVELGRVINARQ